MRKARADTRKQNHSLCVLFRLPEDANRVYDLDALPMLYERQAMPFALYRALNSDFADDDEEVRHYARLAGRAAAERMLLYRE